MELTFSKEPVTLGDLIDGRRVATGDLEALLRLLKSRTMPPATEADLRAIRSDELPTIIGQLVASLKDGQNFKALVEKVGLQ